MSRRWSLKSSIISCHMPSRTLGKDNPTYRDGILRGGGYKDTCGKFERMEIAEAVYEGGAPSKNTQQ